MLLPERVPKCLKPNVEQLYPFLCFCSILNLTSLSPRRLKDGDFCFLRRGVEGQLPMNCGYQSLTEILNLNSSKAETTVSEPQQGIEVKQRCLMKHGFNRSHMHPVTLEQSQRWSRTILLMVSWGKCKEKKVQEKLKYILSRLSTHLMVLPVGKR